MRVAIDATPLTVSSGGIARYTRELALALQENFPEDEFVLVSDQPFSSVPGLKRGGGPRNRWEAKWWLWGLDRELSRLGAGLFHGTDFAVPYLGRRPSVLTLHDLSPWLQPEWHHAAGRVRRRTPMLIRFRIPTMILTDSQAVRREAIDQFGIPPGRIVAVPLAAASHFQPLAAPPSPPYFLYVGTLEPRKNIPDLLAAWREVRRQHEVDLILAGRRRADFRDLPAEPGLTVLGETPEDRLPLLYSGALAFIYPSWYEGFGLPVLEAMQCGACVITSRDPAITEVAGDAAVQVDAGDQGALAAAMLAAIRNPAWVQAMRAKALRRAREFSWARTAHLTREVYAEACRRFA